MKNIAAFLVALTMLAGCSAKLKEKVGLTTSGPDEYKVTKTRPLEVPPHYELKEPATGQKK